MTVTHESRILKYLQNYASEQHGKAMASVGHVLSDSWSESPSSNLVVRRIWAAFLEQEALQLWFDTEHRVWYWGRICHSEYTFKHSSFSRCTWPSRTPPANQPSVLMLHWAKPKGGAVPRDSATSANRCPWQLLPLTKQRLKLLLLCAVACSCL